MSAVIVMPDGVRCRIDDDLTWSCPGNPEREELLNRVMEFLEYGGGADPNPPATAADAVVKSYGGQVESFDPTESKEGIVY